MILEILRLLFGLLLVLFVPGYCMSLILFRKLELTERLAISLGLSIVLVVFLGFFLSTLSYITGFKMITAPMVWTSLLGASALFLLVVLVRFRRK